MAAAAPELAVRITRGAELAHDIEGTRASRIADRLRRTGPEPCDDHDQDRVYRTATSDQAADGREPSRSTELPVRVHLGIGVVDRRRGIGAVLRQGRQPTER